LREIVEKSPIHDIAESWHEILKINSIQIILFIIGLLLVICVTHPLFFINDEWITANQLNQLNQGHQIVVNEGKYGYLQNGTPNPYFEARNNALMYPIFFPIISLPALKIITLLGDTFDYWLICAWSILLILLGLLIQKFHPQVTIFRKIPLSSLLIILAFIVFFLNMALYIPFTINPTNAPKEVAAIVLTNDILFSGIIVIIFSINECLFQDRWFVWVSTFICVSSSSYLIWVSSAKDHILTTFLLSLVIFGLVKFFYTKKIEYCYFLFFMVGLCAWERPEIGIFIFSFLFLSILLYFLIGRANLKMKYTFRSLFISLLFTAIGSIPLFINNYIVTKNPFIPVYIAGWSGTSITNGTIGSNGSHGFFDLFQYFFQIILFRVFPQFNTLGNDIVRILFLPESGSIGIFIIAPLFLIGVILLAISWKFKSINFSNNEKYLIITLLFLILANFVAYLNSFHILNTDAGIFPDVRYLSPIYLPLNLVGLIILSKFANEFQNREHFFEYIALLICSLIVVTVGIVSLVRSYSSLSNIAFLMLLIIVFISAVFIILLYFNMRAHIKTKAVLYIFGLLIVMPLIWQVSAIYFIEYAARLFAGYTYLLPVVRDISYFVFTSL
jgi:hypothetical protein